MKVNEYRELLHNDMETSAAVNNTYANSEFLNYVVGLLVDAEEFDDFVECYYEGVTRRKATMIIDGYALDEADGSCCVFISDYSGEEEDTFVGKTEIDNLFKRIRYFVEESVKYDLFHEMEESTEAYEFSRHLHYEIETITKFRFYVLTDAYNKQKSKNIKDIELFGKRVELNVWDINRIFDLVNSTAQKESIDIVLSEIEAPPIPCVKAVEYADVTADIDEDIKYDDDLFENDKNNKITYTSYLAVVSGETLNKLYLEYGARLLEGNVRSFLSVRGKVNKSIQNTIKNYPEMFFAYNNGIAATATEVEVINTYEGPKISRIKDLQIVNGGQTTASITNTILNKKSNENIDLSRLFVPMKLSVLEQRMSEKIIPKISEYSNSQNKVDASDFFSNHPFHIRMEEYSRKIAIPAVGGIQYQQYWFYERTRGQYNQGKMKFKPKSVDMRKYEARYPEKQIIKMVELAKYMEIYDCNPHIVSKGKQALVKNFAPKIKEQWNKSDAEFNEYYYKRVVALAIIFKRTDGIIKNTDWYKEKKSYKANVVAYTMSIIFNFIKTKMSGFELDFMRIWNSQDIYNELQLQIEILSKEVYDFITGPRETENVTEWCKKELCWTRAKQQQWNFLPEFAKSLISNNEINSNVKSARRERKMDNEIEDMKFVFKMGSSYWARVLNWGESRKLLTDIEKDLLKLVMNMETSGKIPTDKQIKRILATRKKLISEGMPMQF